MLSGKGSELALLVAEALVWLFRMLTTLGLILTAGTPRWFVGTLQCHIHCDKTVPFFSVAWLTHVTDSLIFLRPDERSCAASGYKASWCLAQTAFDLELS